MTKELHTHIHQSEENTTYCYFIDIKMDQDGVKPRTLNLVVATILRPFGMK